MTPDPNHPRPHADGLPDKWPPYFSKDTLTKCILSPAEQEEFKRNARRMVYYVHDDGRILLAECGDTPTAPTVKPDAQGEDAAARQYYEEGMEQLCDSLDRERKARTAAPSDEDVARELAMQLFPLRSENFANSIERAEAQNDNEATREVHERIMPHILAAIRRANACAGAHIERLCEVVTENGKFQYGDTQRCIDVVEHVFQSHQRMCKNLRAIVEAYDLGMGGEPLDELVCAAFAKLKDENTPDNDTFIEGTTMRDPSAP